MAAPKLWNELPLAMRDIPTLSVFKIIIIRFGSTPTFLYFDLYLNSAYAAHYVYLNVAKCNLGKVKKETMIVSGHIRKYVEGSQPLSESCQRGLSLTGLRALQGIVSLCSCLCVDPPTQTLQKAR